MMIVRVLALIRTRTRRIASTRPAPKTLLRVSVSPCPILLAIVLLSACKSRTQRTPSKSSDAGLDAAAVIDATTDWSELDNYPRSEPIRIISIPLAKPDNPRFDVGGPVIANDLAIVASSQIGFVAVDYRRGAIAWTKAAGLHVAPPLVHGASIVLVGDCPKYQPVPDGEILLGCLRVVTTTGSDEAFIAIRGLREVKDFLDEKGEQKLWDVDEKHVRWRKGELAVTVDLLSGVAKPASAEPPPIVVTYKGKQWSITQRDGKIVAAGKQPWETAHEYTTIAGVHWATSPLLRIVDLGSYAKAPEVRVIDMDATGSLHASLARPTPGVALLGVGARDGETAIAVRMDRSLSKDFVVGYAANAFLVYVWPLPVVKRADAVGVVVAEDAVVVFHDGDFVSVLPALSATPTSP